MRIERTVEVDRSVSEVYAYLADFTTTTEWDPGTVSTTLIQGDGGVGTTYQNVSKFLGNTTELVYEVTEHQPDELIALRGENKTVVALDTMTFVATPSGGTRVTYSADFAFHGPAKWIAPLLAPAFKRLGDHAEEGMKRSLSTM